MTDITEIERKVDLQKPPLMPFCDWYASSVRGELLGRAVIKSADEQYEEYRSELAALAQGSIGGN